MNEAEKLTALKRAYADIILNTAKEAAARIMVTERKAMRFQQELFASKEAAVHMLLRVKQMMDCKISEAARTSLSQQLKIDELEAQLNEAEDIVRDLRAELSQVQDELERVTIKRSRMEEPGLKGKVTQKQVFHENGVHTSNTIACPSMVLQPEPVITFNMKGSIFNNKIEGYKCQIGKESNLENQCVSNPDLASTIMMNKEPEQSTKGCTQIDHASERNLLEEGKSISCLINVVRDEELLGEDERGEGKFRKKPVLVADKCCRLQKESDELNERIHADTHRFLSRVPRMLERCQRKRKEICSRHSYDQAIEVSQASDLSSAKIISDAFQNNSQSGENPPKTSDIEASKCTYASYTAETSSQPQCLEVNLSHSGEVDDVKTEPILKQDEKESNIEPVLDRLKEVIQADEAEIIKPNRQNLVSRHEDNPATEMVPSNVSSSENSIVDSHNDIGQCGDTTWDINSNETPKCSELRLVLYHPSYDAEIDKKPEHVMVNDSMSELVNPCSNLQIANNNLTKLIDDEGLNKQENGHEKTSPDLVKKMDPETVNAPLKSELNSIDVTTNAVHAYPANERIIRYTFQRKRKKDVPSSTEESTSCEESILKRKKVEGQCGSMDSPKSSSINESSRDSRRLAQVARQLISLSEKKW